jgi:hypothetical protein
VTPEGRWLRLDDGELVSGGMPPAFEPAMPEDVRNDALLRTVAFLLPAPMTVSFMHCRNVTARSVTPPEPLSRSWKKRRGRPLVRYELLEIAPMREVLDTQGQARSQGLGHAFHICRGHFKTFTDEAPLFGRVTGQFWWADHVRGSPEHGEVIKDYRVRPDQPRLGRPYERADEQLVDAPRAHIVLDPDAAGSRPPNAQPHAECARLGRGGGPDVHVGPGPVREPRPARRARVGAHRARPRRTPPGRGVVLLATRVPLRILARPARRVQPERAASMRILRGFGDTTGTRCRRNDRRRA